MKKETLFSTLTVAASLAVLFLAVTAAPARGASTVRVTTNFDNAYIDVSHPGERHLEIEVTAPDEISSPAADRPAMNLALVIDKSGSMAEAGKLQYVKEAAREMVDRLQYGDRFSLVVYDDGVRVLIPSEALEDRDRARRLIDNLVPGGSTNLGGGLLEGYSQVRRHFRTGGINRVLLLSDGLANRGITSPRDLSQIVNRESSNGISLTTFGVGLHFNEDLMSSMAESGRGTYYYIDRPQRIGEVLAREFSAARQVVALDVIITIEVRPEVVVSDIMGYEYRRDGNRYTIRLGDISSGERRRVMVRLNAPAYSHGDHRIGDVRMSYQRQGGDSLETSRDLHLKYVRDEALVDENLDRDIAERSAVYEANDARQRAAAMVDRGDREGAREVLAQSNKRLEEAPVQSAAVKDEIAETESYQSTIDQPMSGEEKASVQKKVKYDSYRVLQSK